MILKLPLLELIKSLTSTEKRYFNLLSSAENESGQNNYIRLFNCYDSMSAYDEAIIHKEFNGETILKQIHVTENYLYHVVLKSLRNFHSENNIDSQIRDQLNEVEILYTKGLYDQCYSALKRIEKIAEKYENQLALIEVNNWYSELKLASGESIDFNNHSAIYKNEMLALDAQKNNIEYKKLSGEFFSNLKNTDNSADKEQLKEIEKIILSSLLQSEAKAFAFLSKLRFYELHGTYQTLKGDFEKAISFQQKAIALLEANKHQVQKKPLIYLISMNDLITGLIKTKQYDEAFLQIEKLRTATETFGIKNTSDWQNKIFTITYSLELNTCLQSGQFKKGIVLVEELQKGMDKFKKLIDPVDELLFSFNIACLYFSDGQLKESLRWINKLLNNPNKELRSDISSCARMMQLIIYYELKDFETLPFTIINTSKYLKSIKKAYRSETALLTAMRKLENDDSKKEKQILEKLKSAFEEIFTDNLEAHLLVNFNFLNWVENKIDALFTQQSISQHQ